MSMNPAPGFAASSTGQMSKAGMGADDSGRESGTLADEFGEILCLGDSQRRSIICGPRCSVANWPRPTGAQTYASHMSQADERAESIVHYMEQVAPSEEGAVTALRNPDSGNTMITWNLLPPEVIALRLIVAAVEQGFIALVSVGGEADEDDSEPSMGEPTLIATFMHTDDVGQWRRCRRPPHPSTCRRSRRGCGAQPSRDP